MRESNKRGDFSLVEKCIATFETSLESIRETFSVIEEWEERYAYLIELGRSLPPFPESGKIEQNRVRGCQSRVWVIPSAEGTGFQFRAESDSLIVNGLIAVLMAIFLEKSPHDVLQIDETAIFRELDLEAHLSAGRRNGLRNLVLEIKAIAKACDSGTSLAASSATL